jgi:hypothetical protein
MMATNISTHVRDTEPKVLVREEYAVIHLEDAAVCQSLFFKSEESLREFAESILQQLDSGKEFSPW